MPGCENARVRICVYVRLSSFLAAGVQKEKKRGRRVIVGRGSASVALTPFDDTRSSAGPFGLETRDIMAGLLATVEMRQAFAYGRPLFPGLSLSQLSPRSADPREGGLGVSGRLIAFHSRSSRSAQACWRWG